MLMLDACRVLPLKTSRRHLAALVQQKGKGGGGLVLLGWCDLIPCFLIHRGALWITVDCRSCCKYLKAGGNSSPVSWGNSQGVESGEELL